MNKFYKDMADDIKSIMESDNLDDDIDLYVDSLINEETEQMDDLD